nr:MAG TPA: hypothetical protein [Bacteriophage sp.]
MVDKWHNIWCLVYGRNCGLSKRAKRTTETGRKSTVPGSFHGSRQKRGVPLLAGCQEFPTKPLKYSQKQKDLGVDRVAPDKLQPFTASTPIKERICL